ncbi:DDHD domain-containing protein [Zychaea mexicana]|uniref:DDHD domain-containing protein n=1 Tax=Zychaea mexicana TaxID=64656 RepID=UPI0022FDEF93|nr:DDHD domain-containing protein [Zychaea mexicana]KAI9499448.1 DDHD domain-containing protein [Zychaea mexicana]
MQYEGSKWVPCEEVLAQQIEAGYRKHKPYVNPEAALSAAELRQSKRQSFPVAKKEESDGVSSTTIEEKKLEMALAKRPVERQWNLLGPYLGQYVAYTGTDTAWLLSNSTSSKLAKSIITRLTNKQNLGGTRLVRGYRAVDEQLRGIKKGKPTATATATKTQAATENDSEAQDDAIYLDTSTSESDNEEELKATEDDGDGERRIDHLVFVVPGVGQKFSGQSVVDDVNDLRKSMKLVYPTAIASDRSNGIQVLPIPWRQGVRFGLSVKDQITSGAEADLGMPDGDDGCPTLDELTVDSVPNIRNMVSDVIMDVPLYLTPKYREQMTITLCKLVNRIYLRFVSRHPDFLERNGQVSIVGHSLGALIAFDMLSMQPANTSPADLKNQVLAALEQDRKSTTSNNNNNSSSSSSVSSTSLLFNTQNFFSLGSPAGVMMLLKGYRIASRKNIPNTAQFPSRGPVQFCYPAVENLYNIFHKSDPVAYRLEPLISRQYGTNLKPEPIPRMKELIKRQYQAANKSGSGKNITNRAGAMYESIKYGLTANLVMRGLGLSRQQMYDDMTLANNSDDENDSQGDADDAALSASTTATATTDWLSPERQYTHARSSSDSAVHATSSFWASRMERQSGSGARRSPPAPLNVYSEGARRVRMLNSTGRVDYCLQENNLENPYWSALSTHLQYWKDLDVAAFLTKEIYREED